MFLALLATSNAMEESMDEQSRKYITKYVEDLHSLVSHGLQPIAHQLGESQLRDHPEAQAAIQGFHTTLRGQQAVLQQRLSSLGTSPTTAVQDAAATVVGTVAGLYNHVRTEAVAKSVRDDYTFISTCSIAWLMLLTTARSLGDHETEELAEQGYRECARMVMDIDSLMPQLVVRELQQDKLPAQDVTGWARDIVHNAWSRQAAGTPA